MTINLVIEKITLLIQPNRIYRVQIFKMRAILQLFIFLGLSITLIAQPGGGGGVGIGGLYDKELKPIDLENSKLSIRKFISVNGEYVEYFQKNDSNKKIKCSSLGMHPNDYKYGDLSNNLTLVLFYMEDTMIIKFPNVMRSHPMGACEILDSVILREGIFNTEEKVVEFNQFKYRKSITDNTPYSKLNNENTAFLKMPIKSTQKIKNNPVIINNYKDSLILNFDFQSHGNFKYIDTFPKWDSLAVFINSCPTLKFEIKVHSDIYGHDERNKRISEQKAKDIEEYLLGKGVNPEQIQSRGIGEEEYLFAEWHNEKSNVSADKSIPTNARIELKFYGDTLPNHFYKLDSTGIKDGYWSEGCYNNKVFKGFYNNGLRISTWQEINFTKVKKNEFVFYDYGDGRKDSLPEYKTQYSAFYHQDRCKEEYKIKDGWNKLYTSCKFILAEGEFKCGDYIKNGKIYIYTANSELIRVCVIKNFKYYGAGQP
jgi:outer membrane protein OmpA-like peptidoglycan-associated protein